MRHLLARLLTFSPLASSGTEWEPETMQPGGLGQDMTQPLGGVTSKKTD